MTGALSAGAVVTRDGASIGLEGASGRRAEITWKQAAAGLLAVSPDPQAAARVSFPIAAAAVRRRKTVIVVDLTGSPWLADALSGVCAAAPAPLARFSPAGPARYEPFRSHPPIRAAALAIRMVSWAGTTDRQRQAGQRCLADALAVLAASPAPPPVLEGLIYLLDPARLREEMAAVPGPPAQPGRAGPAGGRLGRRPGRRPGPRRGAGQPATAAARQRPGPLALAARPARPAAAPRTPAPRTPPRRRPARRPAAPRIARPDRAAGRGSAPPVLRLGQAVRDRGCALFSLGPPSEAAAMVGRLAVADLAAVLAGLRDQRLQADCLAWVHGCELIDRPSLAALLGLGAATSTSVLLSTASPAAAASLAPAAGLTVAAGPVEAGLAARLAGLAVLTGDARQAAAEALQWQDEDEFAIVERGAALRPDGRSVSAAWARLP